MKLKILICIFVRFLMSYIVYMLNKEILIYLSIPAFIISLGFLRNYLNHKENEVGFNGGKVWWNNYRLLHSITYGLFGIMVLKRYKYSWAILLVDAMLGLIFLFPKL
jgi:hypothetical protein